MHKLPPLPYDFGAFEPALSGAIMELHYTKHHQAYVTNLNLTLDKYREAEARGEIGDMIALQPALKFNGGGHINHSIFWTLLAPPSDGGGETPRSGELLEAIEAQFGSWDHMKSRLSAISVAIQGSGWGWLGYDRERQSLILTTCPNQDPLQGAVPLIGIDVWEHAYYLQYKNVRAEYIKNFWTILNWTEVERRYQVAKK